MRPESEVKDVLLPVICDQCGTRNRDSAMFCIGCAGRLPAFAPSGPSALEAMRFRPPGSEPRAAREAGSATAPLPAESASFWLRLGGFTVALSIAFLGWYFYVTRSAAPPSVQPAPAVAAVDRAAEPAKAAGDASGTTATGQAVGSASVTAPPSQAVGTASVAAPPSTTRPSDATADAASTASRTSPADALRTTTEALLPARSATGSSANPSKDASQIAERAKPAAPAAPAAPSGAAGAAAAAGSSVASTEGTVSARSQRRRAPIGTQPADAVLDDLSAASTNASPAWRTPRFEASSARDLGPPIAPGPGPVYDTTRSSSRALPAGTDIRDPGPPVAPGPGPLYEETRSPRTSGMSSSDGGPPIAAGPGPQYDDGAAGGSRSRSRVAGNSAASDPLGACADLDFLSMNNCRNVQCQRPELRWHPRCESARQQAQERDEARRKLATGG
ncbi:conserved hypothetical protein [Burkholderiales bacterium 8X]|nr:conserved hypothetical protein [Burkholderiales bacterium 8X]